MKIQQVQFPLNLGTADELRIVIEKSIAYYTLIDNNQTTFISNEVQIPYRILYSNRLLLGEQQDTEAITNLVVNLLGVTLVD
jgi:hypothetical protein